MIRTRIGGAFSLAALFQLVVVAAMLLTLAGMAARQYAEARSQRWTAFQDWFTDADLLEITFVGGGLLGGGVGLVYALLQPRRFPAVLLEPLFGALVGGCAGPAILVPATWHVVAVGSLILLLFALVTHIGSGKQSRRG